MVRVRLHGGPSECEDILRVMGAGQGVRLLAVSPIYMDRYPSAYGRIYAEVERARDSKEER